MIKNYLTFTILFFYLVGYSQPGKITVRKTQKSIIKKTLKLNDLRGALAGSITFNNKTNCTVNLTLQIKNPIIKKVLGNKVPTSEKLNCSYSILNDSLLVLKHTNYNDTCY